MQQTIFSFLPYIAIAVVVLFVLWLVGIRFVPNNKVGIVEKCISGKKSQGNSVIALNGEAGYQAEMLRGGIHILPRIFNKLHKVELVTVAQGEIGYVFARDGEALDTSQTVGRCVDCKNFENVRAFIENHGQKGPQRAILREGTYAINLAQFVVLTSTTEHYMPLGLNGEEQVIQSMRETIERRDGFRPVIVSERSDMIGVVTVHDGPSLAPGELIADSVKGHNQFQDPQKFIDNGGHRGRQKDVLTDGTYFINALFASVDKIGKLEIPIGMVGVVNYFTGPEGEDISEEAYYYGSLVKKWERGVWAEALEPGKYPWNPFAGKIYLVPTTNIVLNWTSSEKGEYDSKLAEISLITEDAFQPSLPISAVISINSRDASKVIQRFGDIESLVTETLDPFVGAYFKNIAQKKTIKALIQERSEIQEAASEAMKKKFAEYNLNLVEVLIGTPQNSEADTRVEELYKQLQDRQLAQEEKITLGAQVETEVERQRFEKAKKAAEMQEELTKSEMEITIAENEGAAKVKTAEQDALVVEKNANAQAKKTEIDATAAAKKVEIEANANASKITVEAEARAFETTTTKQAEAQGIAAVGSANASAIGKQGVAEAVAYQEKVNAFGQGNFTQIELISAIAEAIQNFQGNLVPSTLINMGEGSAEAGSSNILSTLLLKEIVEKELGNDEAQRPQDPEMQRFAEELKKQVREDMIRSNSTDETNTPLEQKEEPVQDEVEVGEVEPEKNQKEVEDEKPQEDFQEGKDAEPQEDFQEDEAEEIPREEFENDEVKN